MSKLNWDLKIHTLSIFKRFSFSFPFFSILDFGSQKNAILQRFLRSTSILCVVYIFEWLHDNFEEKKMLTSLQPVGFEAFGARTGNRTAGTDDTRWMLSRSGSFRHYIRWKHMLSDVSWRNDLDLDWFSQMTCTNRSLWFGWFRVVLPAIYSLRVIALTSGWVTKLASLRKKLKCPSQPV